MKPIRFTRRAEIRLTEIAAWTIERFGARQANNYQAKLLQRMEALARGEAISRSCAMLLPEGAAPADLRYIRVQRHYIIFVDRERAIVILDFVHVSRNLEAVLGEIDSTI